MDQTSISNKTNYNTSGILGYPEITSPVEMLFNSVDLSFAEQISSNKIYSLSINHTSDCAGNQNNDDTIYFGVPQHRERIFFVGYDRKAFKSIPDFNFPKPGKKKYKLRNLPNL